MQTLKTVKDPGFVHDVKRLFAVLPVRRKWELAGLFILQSLGAVCEVASLGAVIPFLGAITNVDKLMANGYVQTIMHMLNITDRSEVILLFAGVFSAAIVLANIIRYLTLWAQVRLSAAISTDMGMMLFKNMLLQPYSYFLRNNSSNLIATMLNDLSNVLGVVQSALTIITQGILAVAIALSLLAYNFIVAIGLSVIAVVAYGVIMALITKRLHNNSTLNSNSYRGMVKALQEGFGGVRYIALDRTYDHFVKQYEEADRPYRGSSADNSILRQAPRFFVEAIGVVTIALVSAFIISRTSNMSDVITLMGFLALGAYRLLPAVQQVYTSLSTMVGSKASLHRTVDLMCREIPEHARRLPERALPLNESLDFENIWFDYADKENPDEDWTMKDISLSIKARTTIAFVGATGSGKSTAADLILGLIRPQQGRMSVDGVGLNNDNLGAWQHGIAHVPQGIFLTDTSIAQNIAFGIDGVHIDKSRVVEAAKRARIHDFITTLPRGYDEQVGERGVRLSGGQLQRIGIARALYRNPTLIVFDEATSALDTKTEKEVMEEITALGKDLTIVLIAHRLSTVQKADKIFVFDHGRIVSEGTYEELVNSCGHFMDLTAENA